MTQQQFDSLLETNPNIEWMDDEEQEQMLFRNTLLQWYTNDTNRATVIRYDKLHDMEPSELLKHINKGLEVEGITRITGYFTKIGNWNPGKIGELKDRKKDTI